MPPKAKQSATVWAGWAAADKVYWWAAWAVVDSNNGDIKLRRIIVRENGVNFYELRRTKVPLVKNARQNFVNLHQARSQGVANIAADSPQLMRPHIVDTAFV